MGLYHRGGVHNLGAPSVAWCQFGRLSGSSPGADAKSGRSVRAAFHQVDSSRWQQPSWRRWLVTLRGHEALSGHWSARKAPRTGVH